MSDSATWDDGQHYHQTLTNDGEFHSAYTLEDGSSWPPLGQYSYNLSTQTPILEGPNQFVTPNIIGQLTPSETNSGPIFPSYSFQDPPPFYSGIPTPNLSTEFRSATPNIATTMTSSGGYSMVFSNDQQQHGSLLYAYNNTQGDQLPFISGHDHNPYHQHYFPSIGPSSHHGQLPPALKGPGPGFDYGSRSRRDQPAVRKRATAEQSKILEAGFQKYPKPDKDFREELSRKTNLPTRNIKIWFQNRRAKARNNNETEILRKLADHKTGTTNNNTNSIDSISDDKSCNNSIDAVATVSGDTNTNTISAETAHVNMDPAPSASSSEAITKSLNGMNQNNNLSKSIDMSSSHNTNDVSHVPTIGAVPDSLHDSNNSARNNMNHSIGNPKISIQQSRSSSNIVPQVIQVPLAFNNNFLSGKSHNFFQASPGYVPNNNNNNLLEYDTPLPSDSEFTPDDQGLLTPMSSSLRSSDSPFVGSFREKRTPKEFIADPTSLSGEFKRPRTTQINVLASRRYSVASENGSATELFFSPTASPLPPTWTSKGLVTNSLSAIPVVESAAGTPQIKRSRSISGLAMAHNNSAFNYGEYDGLGLLPHTIHHMREETNNSLPSPTTNNRASVVAIREEDESKYLESTTDGSNVAIAMSNKNGQ